MGWSQLNTHLQRTMTCTLTPFSLSCFPLILPSPDRRSLCALSLDRGVCAGDTVYPPPPPPPPPPLLCCCDSITETHSSNPGTNFPFFHLIKTCKSTSTLVTSTNQRIESIQSNLTRKLFAFLQCTNQNDIPNRTQSQSQKCNEITGSKYKNF